MNYLYPGELKHQIFEFARRYRWKEKICPKAFSEDFIVAQLSVDRSHIRPGTLRTVMQVATEVVPSDRFNR